MPHTELSSRTTGTGRQAMALALGMCKREAIPERSTVHQKIPMQRRRAMLYKEHRGWRKQLS